MAEMTYPAMNNNKNMSCSVGCLNVSKILRRIKPAVPISAKIMLNPERIFSSVVVLAAKRPRCRSHLSDRNDASRNTVVTQEPAMNRGFRFSAPTSDMYAMLWVGSMDG